MSVNLFWKCLTYASLVLHAAWLICFFLLPIWAWRRIWARILHTVLLWTTMLVELSGYYCPLTVLESCARMQYDPSSAYQHGFVADWAERLLAVEPSTYAITAVTIGWTLLWTLIYLVLWSQTNAKVKSPAS